MPMITEAQLDEVAETLAREADLYDDEFSVRRDYSGRGMYGRTCVGFVVPDAGCSALVTLALFAVLSEAGEDGWALARNLRQDSMGLGTIIYFEDLQLDDDDA